MFTRLAHLTYRRRRQVIGAWLIMLLIACGLAAQTSSVLKPGDYQIPGTDTARVAALLDRQFHQDDKKVTYVVLQSAQLHVGDADFRRAAWAIASRIRQDRGLRIVQLDDPLTSGNPALISRDRHSIAITLSSDLTEPQLEKQIDHLRALVRTPGFTSYVTGSAASNHDTQKQLLQDLAKGESITMPILLLILLLVFGTVVATFLPLILALFSIVLSLAIIFIAGHYLVAVDTITNAVTVLGLGIGVDYSLFILYRFREELRVSGNDVEAAVVRTMETTGRSVFFSGVTVALGIASLLFTGVEYLESLGLGGLMVPLTSLLVSMTLLPALLSVLGTRVNRLPVLPRRFLHAGQGRGWHRLASAIMRRPAILGGTALLFLLGLIYPATRLSLADGSLKNAPGSMQSAAGALYMRDHFPTAPNATQVLVQHSGTGSLLGARELAGLRAFQRDIARDPEVATVTGAADFLTRAGTPAAAGGRAALDRYLSADRQTAAITVISRHALGTAGAQHLVRRLRALGTQYTAGALSLDTVYVGGVQAMYVDYNDALYAHFPLIVAAVLVLTYVFLFFAFRSVFLPLKAVLLNLLSVGAAYGVLQLVFQQGFGSALLGFTPEGGVAGWAPIFMFALLFGLSMDYEVFLLSRIRERWLQTGDNAGSVVYGLQNTGRLITSAAAIMLVAFSGFVLGSQVSLKELGLGLMAAIAIDATVIRIILVPAIMELMGSRNWWVPPFLRRSAGHAPTIAELAEDEQDLAEDGAA